MGNQPGTPGYDPRYPSNHNKNYQSNTQIKPNQTNLQRGYSNNGNVSSSYESPQLHNQYSQNSNNQTNNQIPQQSDSLSKKPSFGTKVQAIDKIKVGIKLTRDKVDRLIGQYENQIQDITKALNKQKQNGLNNKKKAVILLKQRKQFQKQVQNLQTRKQVVLKTLNDLNQQHLDKQMAVILQQSNKYMKNVQDQLENMNWRGILDDVAANNDYYNNAFALEAEQDPEVDRMFQELQKEVLGPNYQPKQRQVKVNLPTVATVQQIKPSIIKQAQKQIYLQINQPLSSNANSNYHQVNHTKQKTIVQNNDKNKKQILNIVPPLQQITSNMQGLNLKQIRSNKTIKQNNQIKQIDIQKQQYQQQKAKKQKQYQQQQLQLQYQQQYQQQLYRQQQYYKQQNQYHQQNNQFINQQQTQQQNNHNKQPQNIVIQTNEANNIVKKQSKQVLLAPTFEQATKQNLQQPTKAIDGLRQYQPQNNNNIYQPSQSQPNNQQFNQIPNHPQKQFLQNNQQQISMNQLNNQVTPFQFPAFNNQGITLNSKMPPRPQFQQPQSVQQPYHQNK